MPPRSLSAPVKYKAAHRPRAGGLRVRGLAPNHTGLWRAAQHISRRMEQPVASMVQGRNDGPGQG